MAMEAQIAVATDPVEVKIAHTIFSGDYLGDGRPTNDFSKTLAVASTTSPVGPRHGIRVNKTRCANERSGLLVAIEPCRTRMPRILRSKGQPGRHSATKKDHELALGPAALTGVPCRACRP